MLGPAMTGNPCRLHPAQMLSRNGPRIAFEESNYRNQSRPEAASAIGGNRAALRRPSVVHPLAGCPACGRPSRYRAAAPPGHRAGPDPAQPAARASDRAAHQSGRLPSAPQSTPTPARPAGLLALRRPPLAVRPGQRARIRPPMLDQPVRHTRRVRHRPPLSYGRRGARPRHPYPGSLTFPRRTRYESSREACGGTITLLVPPLRARNAARKAEPLSR